MAVAAHGNHALPVLITARSPSPYLLEGKSGARSPNARPLPHASQLLSPPLPLPASGGNVQKDVTAQSCSVSAIPGNHSAPAPAELSFGKDVPAEPDVQEHHKPSRTGAGCPLPLEFPASRSSSRVQTDYNKLCRDLGPTGTHGAPVIDCLALWVLLRKRIL